MAKKKKISPLAEAEILIDAARKLKSAGMCAGADLLAKKAQALLKKGGVNKYEKHDPKLKAFNAHFTAEHIRETCKKK